MRKGGPKGGAQEEKMKGKGAPKGAWAGNGSQRAQRTRKRNEGARKCDTILERFTCFLAIILRSEILHRNVVDFRMFFESCLQFV